MNSYQESIRAIAEIIDARIMQLQKESQYEFVPILGSIEIPDSLAEALISFPSIRSFKNTYARYVKAGKKELHANILEAWKELSRDASMLPIQDDPAKSSAENMVAKMACKLYSQKKDIDTYTKAVEVVWKYKNIDPRMLELLHKGLSAELVNTVFTDEEAKEQLLKAEPIFLRLLATGQAKTEGVTKYPKFNLPAFVSFLSQVADHTIDITTITSEDLLYAQKYKNIERIKKARTVIQAYDGSTIRIVKSPSRQRDPRLIDCYSDAILYLWDHHTNDVTAFFPELTSSVLQSVLSTEEQKKKLLDNEWLFNRRMQVNNGPNSRKFSKHLLMTFLLKVSKGEIKLK